MNRKRIVGIIAYIVASITVTVLSRVIAYYMIDNNPDFSADSIFLYNVIVALIGLIVPIVFYGFLWDFIKRYKSLTFFVATIAFGYVVRLISLIGLVIGDTYYVVVVSSIIAIITVVFLVVISFIVLFNKQLEKNIRIPIFIIGLNHAIFSMGIFSALINSVVDMIVQSESNIRIFTIMNFFTFTVYIIFLVLSVYVLYVALSNTESTNEEISLERSEYFN